MDDPERIRQEYIARQRNIVFPDTTRNARFLYAALLGRAETPLVVRIGGVALAVMYLAIGIEMGVGGVQAGEPLMILLSLGWVALALWVIWKQLRKPKLPVRRL